VFFTQRTNSSLKKRTKAASCAASFYSADIRDVKMCSGADFKSIRDPHTGKTGRHNKITRTKQEDLCLEILTKR
jgi:hypothetical protein